MDLLPRTVPGAIGGRSVLNRGDFLLESSCCKSGCWPRGIDTDAGFLSTPDICSVDVVLEELSQQQHELPFIFMAEPAQETILIRMYQSNYENGWNYFMLHSLCVRMSASSVGSISTCISSSSREWFSTESKLPAEALNSDEVSSGDLLRRLMRSKLAVSPDTRPPPLVLLLLLSVSVMLAALSSCADVSNSPGSCCNSDWWLCSGRLRRLGGSGGGSPQGISQLSDMWWVLES